MKICFFGVGGVGGYFGAIIANKFKDEHDIYFVARGDNKTAICSNGLTLKRSAEEQYIRVLPTLCTDKVDNLPVCDLVFLSVKGYDLADAAKSLNKITNEKTIILPLLNGVDIYDRMREYLFTGIILPSCVYISSHVESPGVIVETGGSCKLFIGRDPGFPDFYPESLLQLLEDSNFDFTWDDHIEISIWSKYMFIASFGLVTATYGKTLGEILDDSELSRVTKAIMYEIEKIAREINISLDPGIVEDSFLKAKQYPYGTKTSLQRDVESKGKINEIDLFGGTMIRYSERYHISVPNIKEIYKRFLRKFE